MNRDRLRGIIEISGLSRIYGGIRYRFDVEAGQTVADHFVPTASIASCVSA
jgi:hypothetical protein